MPGGKRAEVVAEDEAVAERIRDWLEGLRYDVEVTSGVEPDHAFDCDLVVYHVSEDAARAERRRAARPRRTDARERPRFWLDAVRLIYERAPAVPLLVAGPPGEDVADRALDSGATDVIDETVTPKVFRRRLELLEAFRRAGVPDRTQAGSTAPARRAPGVLDMPLAAVRDPGSGRIDACRVAERLGVSLRRMAAAMNVGYGALHKTPDSRRLQAWLTPVVRVLEIAETAFGSPERVRMWLNRPLHELEDESPLEVILAGEAAAVETLLANASAGIPD